MNKTGHIVRLTAANSHLKARGTEYLEVFPGPSVADWAERMRVPSDMRAADHREHTEPGPSPILVERGAWWKARAGHVSASAEYVACRA